MITGFRASLVALGAGAIAAVGLFYSHRSMQHTREMLELTRVKDREQAELTREGQLTDRYVEAIKLLSNNNDAHLTQRLGGIYALERIMRDSRRDHPTIVEVLSAFVRTASAPESQAVTSGSSSQPAHQALPEDVQVALTVLGRRPTHELEGNPHAVLTLLSGSPPVDGFPSNFREAFPPDLRGSHLRAAVLRNADLRGADLLGADIRGADVRGADLGHTKLQLADLRDAHLQSAVLQRADLQDADFQGAKLQRAKLLNADLQGADLRDANLQGAQVQWANLRKANLRGTDLRDAYLGDTQFGGADLLGARLEGSYLRGANLQEAKGLSVDQVVEARIFLSTALPTDVASDPRVTARIEECEMSAASVHRHPAGGHRAGTRLL